MNTAAALWFHRARKTLRLQATARAQKLVSQAIHVGSQSLYGRKSAGKRRNGAAGLPEPTENRQISGYPLMGREGSAAMSREGSAAWYYEQAIRLRVLATKATNPHIQAELLQAATRFRTLAAEAEVKAEKKRRARESLAAASSAFGERTEANAATQITAAKR